MLIVCHRPLLLRCMRFDLSIFCETSLQWLFNFGSGNGSVPSGNKPLPETMVTQIYVRIWRHYSKNEIMTHIPCNDMNQGQYRACPSTRVPVCTQGLVALANGGLFIRGTDKCTSIFVSVLKSFLTYNLDIHFHLVSLSVVEIPPITNHPVRRTLISTLLTLLQWHFINTSRFYFVLVNFDALAQASDIRIERRQVVFLCWMQDSNPGSQTFRNTSRKALYFIDVDNEFINTSQVTFYQHFTYLLIDKRCVIRC